MTDEIRRDLEQRRLCNERRKQQEIATEAAVRKLNVDWARFQSEIQELGGCGCRGDLRRCRYVLQRMDLSRTEIALVLSYLPLPLNGGFCDCEVFYNFQTEPEPLRFLECVDCGGNYDEWYMVKDAVWAASGLESVDGLLCIGCLELRLRRRLTRDDFQSIPMNQEIDDKKSLRLRDRLTREGVKL